MGNLTTDPDGGRGIATVAEPPPSSTAFGRRSLLKGAVAAAVVVGWDAQRGSWTTAADAAAPHRRSSTDPVPDLDGELVTDPSVVESFSQDFGDLITTIPMAVLRPGSVEDIAEMVRYARRHGLTVAMNGQSGPPDDPESHSNYGQAGVSGGIAIDAGALKQIHHLDATSADVDAGVTWAELSVAALGVGATPPMLTDYLRLSIGGTLSVGGIGGTAQRVGAQVDNVSELTVVTGRGEVVTCSPTVRRGLFHSVLAGAGQCAIIVRATVKLVRAESDVLFFRLFYDDVNAFVDDQLTIMAEQRFQWQEGQIVRRPDDTGWRYSIDVAAYYTPPNLPDQAALLAGLSDQRAELQVLPLPYAQWIFRLEPTVEALRAGGFWDQPKPWVSLTVPTESAVQFISSVVAQLGPGDLGAGLAGLYPLDLSRFGAPLFAQPSSATGFQLNLLRFPFPGQPGIDQLLEQNRTFYDEAVALGGKRYIIGAIPRMTRADWRAHFGRSWPRLLLSKLAFDPDRVLTPGQGIFG